MYTRMITGGVFMFGFKSRNDKEEKEYFQNLMEPRLPVLYRIAYSYFKDKDSASDAVQDAVLKAYKNFEKLRDKDKFNPWLTTILVNRCREVLRKDKKVIFEEYSENIIDFANAREAYSSSSKLEDKLDLLNVLHKLDDKYREVISLKYFGDYTISEIAKVLDIPEGTVKSRLNFGIRKLKTLMEVKNDAM
jgi:RNA polymerase sigma-70 factor, ECF subfamily